VVYWEEGQRWDRKASGKRPSFGNGEEALAGWMNGITGTVVCLLVSGIGIQGIHSSKRMRRDL